MNYVTLTYQGTTHGFWRPGLLNWYGTLDSNPSRPISENTMHENAIPDDPD
ncbi:MAG: hypothetical protein ACQEXX_23495 [Bacillota bacterium]